MPDVVLVALHARTLERREHIYRSRVQLSIHIAALFTPSNSQNKLEALNVIPVSLTNLRQLHA